jgi:hypothetical protein
MVDHLRLWVVVPQRKQVKHGVIDQRPWLALLVLQVTGKREHGCNPLAKFTVDEMYLACSPYLSRIYVFSTIIYFSEQQRIPLNTVS